MSTLLRRLSGLLSLLLTSWLSLGATPTRPIPAVEHVMVISIDGARPDCLLLADTPTLHRMIREGAYTMWAKTTAIAITLPSHVSMVTGVNPVRHGILWNWPLPLREPVYPAVPTMGPTRVPSSGRLRAGKASCFPSAVQTAFAKPKSSTFTRPPGVTFTLAGFKSR